ncbi:MAG TPA: MFS transporter [Gemmatimonadales bacterium]|nr:MFS transporter [Gemmatimonadales bacterium]
MAVTSPPNSNYEEHAGVAAPLRVRLTWLAALSFASGFPFGLVNETLPVYLRTHGAGLVEIGLISAVSFPWTFKFVWAPLVDRVGTRRQWIVGCLAGLTLLTVILGVLELGELARWFWLLLVLMVTLSATQDVAIDAYTIEATSTRELGVANSVRIAAYRIAMFTAGGLLIWIAGRHGWPVSFLTGATMIGALTLAALFIPEPRRTVAAAASVWEPLRELLARRDIWAVVLFALLFKIDIYAMEPMTRPFWVDRGFTLEEIGGILTPGRILATVGGAVLGGLVTTKLGIFRGLWSLGLVQALSSLGYAAVASIPASKVLIITAALFENFAHGLGTAAFLAFLMSVCERRYAATQFAVLSALLALSRTLAGGASGVLAERMGYADYFFLTFVLAIPAFALLPWIKRAGRTS